MPYFCNTLSGTKAPLDDFYVKFNDLKYRSRTSNNILSHTTWGYFQDINKTKIWNEFFYHLLSKSIKDVKSLSDAFISLKSKVKYVIGSCQVSRYHGSKICSGTKSMDSVCGVIIHNSVEEAKLDCTWHIAVKPSLNISIEVAIKELNITYTGRHCTQEYLQISSGSQKHKFCG